MQLYGDERVLLPWLLGKAGMCCMLRTCPSWQACEPKRPSLTVLHTHCPCSAESPSDAGYLAMHKLLPCGALGHGRDVLHAPHAPFMAGIRPPVSLSDSTAYSITGFIWINRIVRGSTFEYHSVWRGRRNDKGIATQLAERDHLTAFPRFNASQTYEKPHCET